MTHINQRRDTAANWTSGNPVLQLGEVGWETNTRKAKLGDGATPWNGLEYAVLPTDLGPMEDRVDALEDDVEDLENTIPNWVPGSYAQGRVVQHLGRFWRAGADTTATPVFPTDTQPTIAASAAQTASGASFNVLLPAGIIAGDLIAVSVGRFGVANGTAPAGWTWENSNSHAAILTKTADGTESGTSVTVALASTPSRLVQAHTLVLRNWTAKSGGNGAGNTTPSLPLTVPLATLDTKSVGIAFCFNSSGSSPGPIAPTEGAIITQRSTDTNSSGVNTVIPGARASANVVFNPQSGYSYGAATLVVAGIAGVASDWELIETSADAQVAFLQSALATLQRNTQWATESTAGVTPYATSAETQAGTVTTKAVTPAGVQAKAATAAEAKTGTSTVRFITPAVGHATYDRKGITNIPVGTYLTPAGMVSGGGAFVLAHQDFFTYPVDVPSPATFSHAGFKVDTAAVGGAVALYVAVYADNGTGTAPDLTQRLAYTTTPAALTAVVDGGTDLAFSAPWVVANPGRYWVASLYIQTTAPTTEPKVLFLGDSLGLGYTFGASWWLNGGRTARSLRATGVASMPTTAITLVPEVWYLPPLIALKRSA